MRKQKSVIGGAVSGLQTLLLVVAMLGLIGVFGGFFGLMQSEIRADLDNTSTEYTYMTNASEAQSKIFSKLPLTATIIIFAFLMILILGVVGYFMARNYQGGTIG
jgi:hypothetical protein